MAKSDEAKKQAEKLEQEHKQIFCYLVQATNFYQNLLRKFPTTNPTLLAYSKKVHKIADSWTKRQRELEKKGVPKFDPKFFDFSKANRKALNAKMMQLINQSNQMGWYTVAIWAGRILLGFAVGWIVDQLIDTAKEKKDLQDETLKTCTTLKLNADECKKFMFEQTDAGSSLAKSVTGSIPWYIWLGGAALAANYFGLFNKFKKSSK